AGRSLVPLLHGRTPDDWRTDFFCEHLMDTRFIPKWEGVRGARYKYARYFQQEPVWEELYDLKKDPREERNLAGDSRHSGLLARLRRECDALRDRYGGPYSPPEEGAAQ
ncbi:MAG: sulfatase/phosphatase domain-containing protein, partial [Armatimonadota bacterium]